MIDWIKRYTPVRRSLKVVLKSWMIKTGLQRIRKYCPLTGKKK
jgi:hypothetical protein